jgi:hypothetical protein
VSVLHEVDAALAAAEIDPRDVAVARLAREYARAIDALSPEDKPKLLGVLGPSLLKALDALNLTPAARGTSATAPVATGGLAKLRAVR